MSDEPANSTLARAVEHLPWKRTGLAIDSRRTKRDVLKRYGIALSLAALALLVTLALRGRIGGAFYQLSFAAVVLSAFFGGRGPGVSALPRRGYAPDARWRKTRHAFVRLSIARQTPSFCWTSSYESWT